MRMLWRHQPVLLKPLSSLWFLSCLCFSSQSSPTDLKHIVLPVKKFITDNNHKSLSLMWMLEILISMVYTRFMSLKVTDVYCPTLRIQMFALTFLSRKKAEKGFTDIQHSASSPLQFFSTLFAPLGFFADKMESFMPSSFWHQLTRIWARTRRRKKKRRLLSCLQHHCPLGALLLIM